MEIIALPMTPFMTNCYVVRHGGEALIVDPGEFPRELADAIKGYTVRTVVNTHCHCDHCGGNGEVLEQTGAELICHENELPLLRAVPLLKRWAETSYVVRTSVSSLGVEFGQQEILRCGSG